MARRDHAGRWLTEALLEEVFRDVVVEELIDPALHRPVQGQHPQIVLIVAQAGAATGGLHTDLLLEFAALGGIVPVVADELRIYHPDHTWLAEERPEALIEQTDQAARWWQDRAAEHLGARRYNLVVEDRFSTPDALLETAKTFDGIGYDVRIAAAAVPAVLSRLGIIETYARAATATGTGPLVSPEDHDVTYDEVTEILYRAEAGDIVTAITVRDHYGVLHDRRRDPSGSWPPESLSTIDVLADARNDPLTRPERTALANRLAGKLEQLADAGVAPRSLYEIAGQVAHDLAGYPLALDRPAVARLNTAMLALLDTDTRPADRSLDTALTDLEALNEELDKHPPWPSPPDAGPEPPPPEPPGPDLGL